MSQHISFKDTCNQTIEIYPRSASEIFNIKLKMIDLADRFIHLSEAQVDFLISSLLLILEKESKNENSTI